MQSVYNASVLMQYVGPHEVLYTSPTFRRPVCSNTNSTCEWFYNLLHLVSTTYSRIMYICIPAVTRQVLIYADK